MGTSHIEGPRICLKIIDSIRDGHAIGQRAKIMIVDQIGGTPPRRPRIAKVPNEFFFLGVHTDDGQLHGAEDCPKQFDNSELQASVGMFDGRQLFVIHAERKAYGL